jgi:hypothetical protein
MKRRKNKCSRRDALQIMGISAGGFVARSPLITLATNLLAGLSQDAMAQATGIKPRRHLLVFLEGAPPRWTLDLFLTPYSSSGFVRNKMVGTRYVASGGKYVDTEYATVNINGINVPWLWQFNCPKAGGGTRPMAELMNNMLALRGINIGDFQHESAQVKLFNPLGATTSLTALAAENSDAPIAALDVDAIRYVFRSNSGITPVLLRTNGNMIANLMDPFVSKTGAAFNSKRNLMSSSVNAALQAMGTFAAGRHPAAQSIFKSQSAADQLLRGAVGDLTASWNSLYGKYQDLMKRAISPSTDPIPGVTDLPVGDGSNSNRYRLYGTTKASGDLRDIWTSSTYAKWLAEHFAVAEYVLINNLSSSVTIAPTAFWNAKLNGGYYDLYFDEHETGDMLSLISCSLYNRAFAACMLELIDRLKAAGQWNETVIDVRGEFGRYGRTDSTGSDHAEDAGSGSFYSGVIPGPMLLGNVQNNSGNIGCYGSGASVTGFGKLDLGHMASSIATLLRAPSPVTASPSLITESGGKIVSLIEKSKQV